MFKNVYKGKKILVTGHTGFKGSWLAMWLVSLGADVTGYSVYLPSTPCHFSVSGLKTHIRHVQGNILDIKKLKSVFLKYKPDMVFHLAAQPLVRRSYDEPKLTFDTNTGGTVNMLECMRTVPGVKAAVMITSDKCYDNKEWTWGYRENDRLGGDDPYSASKACAEIVCHAYMASFFRPEDKLTRIATVRAGNVIGGGDWAHDRIVPDCVRAWACGKNVVIRSPHATRPWQHVLEPLSGYLWLGAHLLTSPVLHGEAFNFGPDQKINKSVKELIELFISFWGNAVWKHEKVKGNRKESTLLKLSCDKALHRLNWRAALSFEETVRFTAEWYKTYYSRRGSMYDVTQSQISDYVSAARKQGLAWA